MEVNKNELYRMLNDVTDKVFQETFGDDIGVAIDRFEWNEEEKSFTFGHALFFDHTKYELSEDQKLVPKQQENNKE